MGPEKSTLSIIIAASNAAATVAECLASVQQQIRERSGVEVIVADASTDGTASRVRRDFPSIRLIERPDGTLIPELWSAGILQAQGDILALTTAHAVPDERWVAEIFRAHQSDYGAIGGAIECGPSATSIDWAIYFCRYTEFMRPFAAHTVSDVAGDNASYKRSALRGCEAIIRRGFWEPFIHTEMRKNGFRLFVDPDIVVYHARSFGFFAFMKQRFQHGYLYGKMRADGRSSMQQVFYILRAPAIPAVLLWRMGHRVWAKRRNRLRWIVSLPILACFVLSWSAGELAGYLGAAFFKKKMESGPLV